MNPSKYDRLKRIGITVCLVLWAGFAGSAWATDIAPTATPRLRVQLQPRVQVREAQVQLGDVAILSSPDLVVLRRAVALPLGHAPRIGETAVLDHERLAAWLRSRTGLREDQVQWEGAVSTALTSAAQELSGDEVVLKAQTALREHLMAMAAHRKLREPRLELQPVSVPLSTLIPLGDGALSIRPLGNTPIGKRMLVWVDVQVQGRHIKTIPVRFEVSLFTLAPIAANDLAVGSSVSAGDLTVREVDVSRLGDTDVTNLGTVTAAEMSQASVKRVRRNVRSGDIVTATDLQAIPAVSRGDWVNLVSKNGLVSLESRVEVLQDGQVGQIVRARAVNATGVLLARVVSAGHLELQP